MLDLTECTRRGVPFADDIDAALVAFADDVSYAVSIARNAVIITEKRRLWQLRREQTRPRMLAA